MERYPNINLTLCDIDGYHLKFAIHECKKSNSNIEVIYIASTDEPPKLPKNFDFIYCWETLEHVPNVFQVVKTLVEHLSEKGILLETFSGETGRIPEESSADSQSAWEQRDLCFDYLYNNLVQIVGPKVEKNKQGHYKESCDFRCWRKP